jgi:mannonate dehydratase
MAAIDIALWDIAGKAASRPVAELLGGMRRDRLRAYVTHPLGTTRPRRPCPSRPA